MARSKLSEYRAKKILYDELDIPYSGLSFDANEVGKDTLATLDKNKRFVVKIDEGIKKRMKKGLIVLDKRPQEVRAAIDSFKKKGYRHFIIEPFLTYQKDSEKYLSIERVREGFQILYSIHGGIDIEENQRSVQSKVIRSISEATETAQVLGLPQHFLERLLKAFDRNYFSFLEINPLVVDRDAFYLIDVAVQVDSAGEFFVQSVWTAADFRTGGIGQKLEEELAIASLSQKSQASFTLKILNPDGGIFMLLSGGGASIVLADEVYNLGFGAQLANYGEYSGNPNAEEVLIYTRHLLSLLLKSKSAKKVLIIGGGVANFTDIRITFKGIIMALDEVKMELFTQGVKVFVRRGGPHQEEGLAEMGEFLVQAKLLGEVSGPELGLPQIVSDALGSIR